MDENTQQQPQSPPPSQNYETPPETHVSDPAVESQANSVTSAYSNTVQAPPSQNYETQNTGQSSNIYPQEVPGVPIKGRGGVSVSKVWKIVGLVAGATILVGGGLIFANRPSSKTSTNRSSSNSSIARNNNSTPASRFIDRECKTSTSKKTGYKRVGDETIGFLDVPDDTKCEVHISYLGDEERESEYLNLDFDTTESPFYEINFEKYQMKNNSAYDDWLKERLKTIEYFDYTEFKMGDKSLINIAKKNDINIDGFTGERYSGIPKNNNGLAGLAQDALFINKVKSAVYAHIVYRYIYSTEDKSAQENGEHILNSIRFNN